MALTNIRLSKNRNIVADREYKGGSSEKVIARTGFKGVYRWSTANAGAREMAREYANRNNLTIRE